MRAVTRFHPAMSLLLVLGLSLCVHATDADDSVALVVLEQIRPEAIRSHVRFLADDPLKGRGTGTESYQIASTYVAAQFEALGLEPGSADSSYFQPVPLRRAVMVPDGTSLVLRSDNALRELQYAEDYLLVGGFSRTHVSVEAPVVFAGFGVTAPELGYDDYATVDAKGKIVAYLSDAPASSADLYFAVVFAEGCRYAVSLVCPA